jgi:hypothetical protein
VFAPWVARNLDQFGEPALFGYSNAQPASSAAVHLPIDKSGGRYGAFYRATHFFTPDPAPPPWNIWEATGHDPWPILWDNVKHRPLQQLDASVYWLRELWLVPFDDHTQYRSPPVVPYELVVAIHALIAALALFGAWVGRRRPEVQVTVGLAVLMTLPYTILLPEPRYAVPMAMLLIVPAGVAVARLASVRGPRRADESAAAAGPAAPARLR